MSIEPVQQLADDFEAPEGGEDEGMEGDGDPHPEPTTEDYARTMGWKPFAEFRGRPEDWTDAAEFVSRGEKALPVLRDNVKRQGEKIIRQDREIAGMRETIAQQSKAVQDAMNLARRADESGYQRGLAELRAEQRSAVETGDADAYDKVQERIDAAQRARQETTREPLEVPVPKPADEIWPETGVFLRANPWVNTDPILRSAVGAALEDAVEMDPGTSHTEHWARAKAAVVAAFPHKFPESDRMARTPEPREEQQRQPPRRAGVLAPTLAPQRPSRTADPFDRIVDPKERAEAKSAYEGVKRFDEGSTPEEYVKLYFQEANPIDLRAQRKK